MTTLKSFAARRLLQLRGKLSSCFSTAVQSKPSIVNKEVQVVSDITDPVSDHSLEHEDFFNVRKMFTIKELLEARVHLGHREGTLDPHMKPYIYGSRLGHLIIDLDQTAAGLTLALNFAAHIAYRDGIILFVGQHPQHSFLIEETAKTVKEFAHARNWRRGMLTNSSMMFGAMTRLPDLIIFLNTLTTVLEQHVAVAEAAKMAIPTIGIVDTNCNPNLITYPIPGNDDTPCAIELYCKLFSKAIIAGKQARDPPKS